MPRDRRYARKSYAVQIAVQFREQDAALVERLLRRLDFDEEDAIKVGAGSLQTKKLSALDV